MNISTFFRVCVISMLLTLPVGLVYAQTETDDSTDQTLEDDVTTDLEAESLPTTNPIAFWLEQARAQVLTVFTLNSQRKEELLTERLHRLDRKMAACAEIGDTECAEKIEERRKALEERTEKYIEKQKELGQEHLDRFEAWREKRQEKIDEFTQKLQERKDKHDELMQKRQEVRQKVMQHREEFQEQMKDHHEEIQNIFKDTKQEVKQEENQLQQTYQEGKQENREQLINARSVSIKNRLDQTQAKVQQHNQRQEEAADTIP